MTFSIKIKVNVTILVRGVFLNISKAFDKVWHKGLTFKLKQNRVTGDLLNILIDFLKERKQRVVLNGQHSKWSNISACVPQGSILGPLLFLIYINDLSDNLSSNPKLFADDTSLFSVVPDMNQSGINLNDDLEKISNWDFQWKMSCNLDINKQAQEVIFSRRLQKPNHPSLRFNGVCVCVFTSIHRKGFICLEQLGLPGNRSTMLS